MVTKTLWIKSKFLKEILAGRKTIEVRVGYRNIQELRPKMELFLNNNFKVKIKDIRRYQSFKEMLDKENPKKIAPGMSKNEVLRILQSLYLPFKEKLGVFAIEFYPLKNTNT